MRTSTHHSPESAKAFTGNQAQRLDLLKKFVNSKCDIKECTVSLVITELRRRSSKTKTAWLSEEAIVAHYFGDLDKAKKVFISSFSFFLSLHEEAAPFPFCLNPCRWLLSQSLREGACLIQTCLLPACTMSWLRFQMKTKALVAELLWSFY